VAMNRGATVFVLTKAISRSGFVFFGARPGKR